MIVPMVTDPVDTRGVLESGRGDEAIGAPAPSGTTMGHVHLQARDIDETVQFYAGDLGLDLTARMGSRAGFFSSNGYHHHIGANTWNSAGGLPAAKNTPRLERIVFAVGDDDQLETARLHLGKAGRAPRGDRGRDLVVTDPNGVELEFHKPA